VYAWLWRHLPFRSWQLKTLVSLVLAVAIAGLLWFKVFPAVEPLLPFDDGQVETTGGQPAAGDNAGQPTPDRSSQPRLIPSPTSHSPRPSR
jgi:hypothetical protein